MYRHGPTCLAGPVSKTRVWWLVDDPEADPLTTRTDIRVELVRRVRREIAEGKYDTPDKWETALERLLDRLEQD